MAPTTLVLRLVLLLNLYSISVAAMAQDITSEYCPISEGYFWSNCTIDGVTTCYRALQTEVHYGFDLDGHYNQYTTLNPQPDMDPNIVTQFVEEYSCPVPIDPKWCSSANCQVGQGHYDCRAYDYCYLPAGSIDTRSGRTGCPTTKSTLSSLAILNVVSIVVSLVSGRLNLGSFTSSC